MPTGTQSQSAATSVRAARWSPRATPVGTCTAHAKFTNTGSPRAAIETGATRPGILGCRCGFAEGGRQRKAFFKSLPKFGPSTIWMIERRCSTCARQANPRSSSGTVDRALESDRAPKYQRALGVSSCGVCPRMPSKSPVGDGRKLSHCDGHEMAHLSTSADISTPELACCPVIHALGYLSGKTARTSTQRLAPVLTPTENRAISAN
jgi:hypothetical protein